MGSTNVGVRKQSEQVLRQFSDATGDKMTLIGPLCSMVQYNSNARLKPALIEQLIDLVESSPGSGDIAKLVLPLSYKLLDDTKPDVKSKTEKLFKRLYSLPGIG